MKKQKKKISVIAALSLISLLILSLVIVNYFFNSGDNKMILLSPRADTNVNKGISAYEINFTNITYSPDQDKWLMLDELNYLLTPKPLPSYGEEHFPLGSEGGTQEEYDRALMEDTNNPYNIATGKLKEIINVSNNGIVYIDNDMDLLLSKGDLVTINYSLISKNLTDEKFSFNIIYIGDLEGSLSKEVFQSISTAIIGRSE